MIGVADLARFLRQTPGMAVENVVVADSVDSTNTLARRLIDGGWSTLGRGPEAVILALEQTAGRGRQGRTWVSRHGLGIYATLLLGLEEERLQTLPLLVGVGVARGLERFGCTARLKWPNDVQVGGRKLGGILIESVSRDASRIAAAIVGFGINHGHDGQQLPTAASTSLRQVLHPLPPFEQVAAGLVASVLAEIGRADNPAYARRAYEERTVHRAGDTLRCRVAHEDLEGTFLGFDERGFLRLAVDGRERRVASGEIVE